MNKPKPVQRIFYNYFECSKYLEHKYGYKERDFAGKYKYIEKAKEETDKKFSDKSWYTTPPANFNDEQRKAEQYYRELMKNEPEYLDFWHWVVNNYPIHNPCFITFCKEEVDECIKMQDWQKEIFQHYIEEFSDENGEIDLLIEW